MKKKYTDSDIEKMLTDLSEFIPEINPYDTEWREFLREFMAARPNGELDAVFAKEIRQRLVQRAADLHIPKQFRLPQWMKLAGTFVAGAAVCAVVIIPILKTPESVQTSEAIFYIPSEEPILDETKINSIEKLILTDSEEIPDFDIAPMAAKRMAPVLPEMTRKNTSIEQEEASFENMPAQLMVQKETVLSAESMQVPLKQDNLSSDLDILHAAILFVEEKGYATFGDPFIDRDRSLEFTDYFEVVFPLANGAELRVKVDKRTLEVVSE